MNNHVEHNTEGTCARCGVAVHQLPNGRWIETDAVSGFVYRCMNTLSHHYVIATKSNADGAS